jgi:hypothetical protein
MHLKTLECPCSNKIIPYEKFISFSPILHQVCSSDLVTDQWITLLEQVSTGYYSPDWRNTASSQFRFLSNLCKLANTTIEDAIQRFLLQSFITSTVLTETDFNRKLNIILEQYFQLSTIYFSLLIKTVRMLTHIDQPYFGPSQDIERFNQDENLIGRFTRNKTHKLLTSEVFISFLLMMLVGFNCLISLNV